MDTGTLKKVYQVSEGNEVYKESGGYYEDSTFTVTLSEEAQPTAR